MSMKDEIRALDKMTSQELATCYENLFGRRPRSRHRQCLRKRVAFRMQENALGGLSSVAKRRLEELIAEIDPSILEPPAPRPVGRALVPGTTLTKIWHGEEYLVKVLDGGFEYNDARYRSLSAIAKVITGTNWNGKVFFGIKKAKLT